MKREVVRTSLVSVTGADKCPPSLNEACQREGFWHWKTAWRDPPHPQKGCFFSVLGYFMLPGPGHGTCRYACFDGWALRMGSGLMFNVVRSV